MDVDQLKSLSLRWPLALLLGLFTLPLTATEAFRWHDADGGVHYGDRPPESARQLAAIDIAPPRYGVAKVFDGDTVELADGRRIRLIGINTPEIAHGREPAQAFGDEAAAWLQKRLEGRRVSLHFDGERRDKYRRWLAYLQLEDGSDPGLELVQAGLAHVAIHPLNVARIPQYLAAERQARAKRLGIWSLPEFALVELATMTPHSGFQRLRGLVLSERMTRKYRYLKLEGRVAASIPRADAEVFAAAGVPASSLVGKRLTLRGWLKRRGKEWRLWLDHPLQLETVE